MRSLRSVLVVALFGVVGATTFAPHLASAATSADIFGPSGSGSFGARLVVLSNGNFVVGDPTYSSPTAMSVGAVYLYNGATRQLISTLTGSTANDKIGYNGFTEVGDSNFVVRSGDWDNGAVVNAGAVTWVNGTTGLNGQVGAGNSLVGSTLDDRVGDAGTVFPLENGNYVVTSIDWDNGVAAEAGAATWGNGNAGVSGPISALNSLVGTQPDDRIAYGGVAALEQGNYVVGSPNWHNGALVQVGAATWANGATGITGAVTAANSLYGATPSDRVGASILGLTNGNYVVRSPNWTNPVPPAANAGAVTWGNGTTGTFGQVAATNSSVGSSANDEFGVVIKLENGNYTMFSSTWDNAGAVNAGAVRLGNGLGGTVGVVSPLNSLVGTTVNDQVGVYGTRELDNGNFVVLSPFWKNVAISQAGAVTWSSGTIGTVGPVSATNSIVGGTTNDTIGSISPLSLPNGNYVVYDSQWDNLGIVDAGAARLASGTGGTVGLITAANAIVGSTANDKVGSSEVEGLSDSSFVVSSPQWDGPAVDTGAATYGKADGSTVGPVTTANSLHGTTVDDAVGGNGARSLGAGAYVVVSPTWNNGVVTAVGAVTRGGSAGIVGPVTVANSLVGTHANDRVGFTQVTALKSGGYVVASAQWDFGAVVDAGAVTWANGTTGIVGAVTASNSLVGTTAGDFVGDSGAYETDNGGFVVQSSVWDNGAIADAGAVTFGGLHGVTGPITAANSVRGAVLNGITLYDNERRTTEGAYVVTRAASNAVTLFILDVRDYIPLAPARIADTRPGFTTIDGQFAGIGVRPLGSTLELVVAGRGGVGTDASAAALNVTVTEAAAAGFATVFPCGSPQPTASNLNFTTGSTVPNAVIAKIGAGGKVCIFVSQDVQLVVDVNGAFPPDTSYVAANPARVLDTRVGFSTVDGVQQGTGAAAGTSVTELQITGRAGVPADATAVVLNVTVTEPVADGYATVYPCGTPPPTASNLNYVPGQTTPNLVIAKLGAGGKVCIFTQSAAQLIADVNGYFPHDTTYAALTPARVLDTRAGFPTIDGLSAGAGQRPLGSVTVVHVLGRGGMPAAATTAILNVTVTEATAPGYVTVYPCGIDPPLASNVNFVANQNIPNAVLTKIGTNGDVCLFTSQPTQLVADVAGYFP